MPVQVKIRHRHQCRAATIEMTAKDEVLVTFAEPQRAITPGQAAVFYRRGSRRRWVDLLART